MSSSSLTASVADLRRVDDGSRIPVADLFDLDRRVDDDGSRMPVADASENCTNNGCTQTCVSCGCTKGCSKGCDE